MAGLAPQADKLTMTHLQTAAIALAYALLLAVVYLLSIQVVWAGYAFFLMMPFVQVWLYRRSTGSDTFGLAKRLGVIPTVMAYLLMRQFDVTEYARWISPVTWVILFINIGMVIVVDVQKHRWSNMLVGAGLILGVGGPAALGYDLGSHRIVLNTSLAWIIAYTGWNAAFVLRRHPDRAVYYACVLGVPIIYGMWVSTALWLEARVMILAEHLLLMDFFRGRIRLLEQLPPVWLPRLFEVLAWVALAWHVARQFMA